MYLYNSSIVFTTIFYNIFQCSKKKKMYENIKTYAEHIIFLIY